MSGEQGRKAFRPAGSGLSELRNPRSAGIRSFGVKFPRMGRMLRLLAALKARRMG